MREQICSVVSLLRPEGSQPLALWAEIGSIFKLTKGAVERHYSRVEEGSDGKNAILDEEQTNAVINFIMESFHMNNPATYDDRTSLSTLFGTF